MTKSDVPVELAAGHISEIHPQKSDPNRVSVFIDGTFAFGVSAEVAASEGLRQGRYLSEDEQRAILAREDVAHAYSRAIGYLSHRARSEHEVRKKLTSADHAEEAVDAVLERLKASGYVDDEAFASEYAEVRLGRGYGPHRVVSELVRRGIPRRLAETSVTCSSDEEDLRAQVMELLAARAARYESEPDIRKRKKKVYSYLMRRGYPADLIWQLMDEYAWH